MLLASVASVDPQEVKRAIMPIRKKVHDLKSQQPFAVFLKFLYVLVWYCISGAVVAFGFVKSVLHVRRRVGDGDLSPLFRLGVCSRLYA